MHAEDVLKYGHAFVVAALDGLDDRHCETSGVCGYWSVKDIMGHLAAAEGLLVEVLQDAQGMDAPRPFLETLLQHGPEGSNDVEYARRKDLSLAAVIAEYETYQAQAAELMAQIPPETRRQAGLLTWYGAEYDLEDFIVYAYYGHKREHGAQINVFKDQLKLVAS